MTHHQRRFCGIGHDMARCIERSTGSRHTHLVSFVTKNSGEVAAMYAYALFRGRMEIARIHFDEPIGTYATKRISVDEEGWNENEVGVTLHPDEFKQFKVVIALSDRSGGVDFLRALPGVTAWFATGVAKGGEAVPL